MNITIIGTGYVGLVTGACLSHVGNNVVCADINEVKIKDLNSGAIPIFEDGLGKIINESVRQGRLTFTSDIKEAIKKSDIIFLAVSTPMNKDGSSKLDYIMKAAEDIGNNINEYKLIIVKSTVPVGTTISIKNKINQKIIDREEKFLFDIANNPEFLKEGKAVNDFMYPDRVIIGLENKKIKNIFKQLYRPFSMNHEKLIFMDIHSSELTKYAANAMLAMKISFINEISQLCEKIGADVNNIRKGIGSDNRIGYSFIYPSIGFGGSCFPKDVNSLKKQFEEQGINSLISNAVLEVNELQWRNFTQRILSKFNSSSKIDRSVSVWGITFKPGTDDIRESQAVKIIDKLLDSKFKIKVYDPQGMESAKKYYKNSNNIMFIDDKYETLVDSNALLLLTEWEEFRSPDFTKMMNLMNDSMIFDGRNIYNKSELETIGFAYYQVGVK